MLHNAIIITQKKLQDVLKDIAYAFIRICTSGFSFWGVIVGAFLIAGYIFAMH